MIKLNPGLSVWEETKNIFSQVISIFMNGTEQKIGGKTFYKTMAKPAGVIINKEKLIF